jgi:spore maturation protein CgeB
MIVGSDEVYAIENFYVKYLREEGVEVTIFPAQPLFYDYYNRNLPNKILYRLGLSSVLSSINKEFKNRIEADEPDIVWIFKGMEIFADSIRWAKKKGIRFVNYNPDNPFIFTGKGSGNKHVIESIGLYDLHLTYNLSVKDTLEKKYKLKAGFLPFGFDVSDEIYNKCLRQTEIIKACFLGNPDKERAAFLMSLAKAGVQMDVYGNDWASCLKHENITIFPPVFQEELWLVLYRYRVQLNLMRIHNLNSHNMRSFEVPGIGGIMLAPDTTEHRMFFEDGREIFLFNSVRECKQKIEHLLSLTVHQAGLIRESARCRSISSGYSYRDRARQAYNEIRRVND